MGTLAELSPSKTGPGGGPLGVVAHGNHQELNTFEDLVRDLYDNDYGDFKRRIGLYLDRLNEDLEAVAVVHQKIEAMKSYLLFCYDEDMEATRQRILQDAESLRRFI